MASQLAQLYNPNVIGGGIRFQDALFNFKQAFEQNPNAASQEDLVFLSGLGGDALWSAGIQNPATIQAIFKKAAAVQQQPIFQPTQVLPAVSPPPPPQVFAPAAPVSTAYQQIAQEAAQQAAPTTAPVPGILPTRLPEVFRSQLKPDEAAALEDIAAQEQAVLELARGRGIKEQLREEPLIAAEAERERQALEAARQRYLQEQQAAIPAITEQFRGVFRPGIEESLKRSAEVLSARGLGTGGFQGSGAFQELARKSAEQLEREATASALQNYLSSQQQYGQLGLEAARTPGVFGQLGLERRLGAESQFRDIGQEAALTPSVFRRAGLERFLTGRDLFEEERFQKELAQEGAASAASAAKRQARGQIIGGAIGTIPFIGPALSGAFQGSRSRNRAVKTTPYQGDYYA